MMNKVKKHFLPYNRNDHTFACLSQRIKVN